VSTFYAALAGLAASFLTCASPAIAQNEQAPPPPPYEGVYQPQGVDEIGMWREDDENERELANSPILIRDEDLNVYLKSVLCSAVGEDRCQAARIYVLREPSFNATMSPNGTMRIYSGMLLRMRNEAELAYILGHEFGHFEQRHSVNSFKRRRTATDIAEWAGVLASFANRHQQRHNFNEVRFQVYGNFHRYRRNNERESDLLGIGYMNQSALRPQAAAEVWENVMGEAIASAQMRGLRKPKFDAIAFTATHPPDEERAAYLSALADPEGDYRDDGEERYRVALAKWLPVFLEDQIKLNDFGGSEYVLDALAVNGWTADLLFARGELYRLRGNPRDHVNAADFYREAISLDPTRAEAFRGLGLSLMKTGSRSEAQDILRRYIELKPDAPDAAMIGMMVPKRAPKEALEPAPMQDAISAPVQDPKADLAPESTQTQTEELPQ